jgi:LmbE family N-acetylglucosaminyl deacetylase
MTITLSSVADLGTILSIWAHPDDETYLCGGIMAAATASGQRVVCVCATAGERGTPDPQAWPPDRLGRVRRWEAAAAMAVLGVTDHRWLDLPDGGLADLDPAGPVARLGDLLAEVAPDTILTFGPDGATYHPDHRTISAWVTSAWDRGGRRGRLLYSTATDEHLRRWGGHYERWGVYMSDERPAGVPVSRLAVHARLDQTALDRKIAALCAMYTQIAPAITLLGEPDFRATNAAEYFVAADESVAGGARARR